MDFHFCVKHGLQFPSALTSTIGSGRSYFVVQQERCSAMNCGAASGFFPHLMVLLKLLDVYTQRVEFTLKLWNGVSSLCPSSNLVFYHPHLSPSLLYNRLLLKGVKIKIPLNTTPPHTFKAMEELDHFLLLRHGWDARVSFTWPATPCLTHTTKFKGVPTSDFYWAVNSPSCF